MNGTLPVETPHLILGGARSGKSGFAERMIAQFPPPYVYVATARVLDEEMQERVRKHRERRKHNWTTIESPIHLVESLQRLQGENTPVLVDCITLWLSNLLHSESLDPEDSIDRLCAFLTAADFPIVIVSNEVGGGIVPGNPLARRFRDLAGWTNQKLAAACPAVTLVVAGIPLSLKSSRTSEK